MGLSEEGEVVEVVGKGSGGAALASQLAIDTGVNRYFSDSTDEVLYGNVRMQPLAFQDDILRLALSTRSAQVGNI